MISLFKNQKHIPKDLVSGYFYDEVDLLEAVKKLRSRDIHIRDVFTPIPVHGLDEGLGLKKSGIPTVGFIFGAFGAAAAFFFQSWVFTESYPMNIGGKPMFSVPTFIPIIFETTVLFAAIGMVFAFLFRSKLGLGAENKIYDPRTTDDHFLVLLEESDTNTAEILKTALTEVGAQGIKEIENN